MNIYFTASLAGKDHYIKNYHAIVDNLKAKGHAVISDHILESTESEVQMSSKDERLKFHAKLEKWLKGCDFIVAETSFPSISVGYEISLALQMNKPVLILYSEGEPPSLLAHHHNDKLVCEKYDLMNVQNILVSFMDYIQGKGEMRFIFFITPQIGMYLDEIAKNEKVPKSVYLRKLIERDMKDRRSNSLSDSNSFMSSILI
jgi:hypothetical protein